MFLRMTHLPLVYRKLLPLGSPPRILETPLSTWGRLANTFSVETRTHRKCERRPLPQPGAQRRVPGSRGGLEPAEAGHLLPFEERRGQRDFLVHVRGRPSEARAPPPGPQRQLRAARAGGAGPHPGRLGAPPTRTLPAAGRRGRQPRPPGAQRALTDLVRHPRPLVTAPCSPRACGARRAASHTWPRPSPETGTRRKAAPGVQGAEGAVRSQAPGPARACPARYRCGAQPGSAAPRAARPQL